MEHFKKYFVIACLLLPVVGAFDQLCIGADNELQQLFIDGVDVTSKLANRVGSKPGRHCDCINIPADSGVIAVKASAKSNDFGIQWCDSENRVLQDSWRCISNARLLMPPKSKRAKKLRRPNGSKWMTPDYDDSWWKTAKKWSRDQHCKRYNKLPCRTVGYYWTNKPVLNQPVYCRLKACAENCKSCATVAPGQCDPGQCTFGSGVNSQTQATMCQRKCWLEVKAVGILGPVNTGYIKVTDGTAKSTAQWIPNEPGRYAAIIDMASCGLLSQTYQPWSHDSDQTLTINQWKNAEENTNLIAVDFAVGNGMTGEGMESYAPWIDIWPLGVQATNPIVELSNGNGTLSSGSVTYKTCITGVPYGTPTLTESC